MPVDAVAPPAAAPQTRPARSLPAESLNDPSLSAPSFGALLQQDLKAGLRPGPKLSPGAGDGFKSTEQPQRFIPLNRPMATAPLRETPPEALGAETKHPLGPQKR
jgi:hypothetical protein